MSPETEAWQRYEFNQQMLAPVHYEQTARARGLREINRIALHYGWQSEVARAVDRAGAAGLGALDDREVEELASHMRHLVDCAQHACDVAEAPPAR